MLTVKEVRRIYSIKSILGVSVRTKKIVCPLPYHVHNNYTPSFSIFIGNDGAERFECHGNCGKSGDVVDFIGHMNIPGYEPNDPSNVAEAIRMLTSGYNVSMPRAAPRETGLHPHKWMEYYPPRDEAIEYAKSRGISESTLLDFRVGQNGRFLAIPAFEEGALKAIKFRNMRQGMRFYAETGSVGSLFNYDNVAYQTEPVLVLKGEIPCMVLWQRGIHCCGFTGGEGMVVGSYLPVLALSQRRIYVGDNDIDLDVREQMQKLSERTADALTAELLFPPEQYKDIDDWVLDDEEKALSTIREWMYG